MFSSLVVRVSEKYVNRVSGEFQTQRDESGGIKEVFVPRQLRRIQWLDILVSFHREGAFFVGRALRLVTSVGQLDREFDVSYQGFFSRYSAEMIGDV